MPVRQCPHCKAIQPIPETPTAATVDCQVCGRSILLVGTSNPSEYVLLLAGAWTMRIIALAAAAILFGSLVLAQFNGILVGSTLGSLIVGLLHAEALFAIRDAARNSWHIRATLEGATSSQTSVDDS